MSPSFPQSAEAMGLNSADSASVNIPSSVIFESDNDLKASIHNVSINLQGDRNSDGTWNINTNINDTYDFKAGGYTNPLLGTANNAAVASQTAGAVSNYSVGIQFTDKHAKKK